MRSKAKLIVLFAGLALFVAAFGWLLTRHGPLAPVRVQTGKVVRGELRPSVFGVGAVDARLSYAVGPLAPGRVLRVLVDQGDEVKAGQLLAEMDPVDMDRRVQAARSVGSRSRQAVQVARAQIAEAESRAKLASANLERTRLLYQRHVISKQALDNSSNEAERAAAALAAAQANAAAASQDTARAKAEFHGVGSLRESLRLVSPVDGVIVAREAEPGTTVVAGQAVLRLIDPASLWVRARVDQSSAQGVKVGQPASIVLRSAPGQSLRGKVARIELQSDPITEERIVDVSFAALPEHLYLGELAEVTIQLPRESDVLTVPAAAVAREGGKTGVWRAEGGRARFQPVSFGRQAQPEMTRIIAGLQEGQAVIVYSAAQLGEGVRVREKKIQ